MINTNFIIQNNELIAYEKEYKIFLEESKITSADFYISQLKNIASESGKSVSPINFHNSEDVLFFLDNFPRVLHPKTKSNYKSYLNSYVRFVQANKFLAQQVKVSSGISDKWEQFNIAVNEIALALGRTNNIVGEYAERLVAEAFNGILLPASNKSADVSVNNALQKTIYQVKARRINGSNYYGTQLGVIRSWDFDYLIVVLFDEKGQIVKGLKIESEKAKNYIKNSTLQNGAIIHITKQFEDDCENITELLKQIKL